MCYVMRYSDILCFLILIFYFVTGITHCKIFYPRFYTFIQCVLIKWGVDMSTATSQVARASVTCTCEQPSMGAEDPSQVLCMSSTCS